MNGGEKFWGKYRGTVVNNLDPEQRGDFGNAIWCAFPSSDFGHPPFSHPEPLTPGIWTTDRRGQAGYNVGRLPDGDAAGNYTNSFGGTSSACPGAAGVVALIVSVNSQLRWHEVRKILRRSCDRIDPQNGSYDVAGHSSRYGYGRLNARTAVDLAHPQPQNDVAISRTFDGPIPDLGTVTYQLAVSERMPVETLTVTVDIKHTYIGDLIMTLQPPASIGASAVVLHNRAGGSTKNLQKTYDAVNTPKLAAFVGKNCQGTWKLQIQAAAAADSGTLTSFGLTLSFPHPDRSPRVVPLTSRVTRKQGRAKKKQGSTSRSKRNVARALNQKARSQ